MNFKRFGLGKQLINPSVATYGKYIDANGIEQTSASGLSNHTDYIPVTANRLYTVSYDKPSVSGNIIAVSWYDSNKIFIKRDSESMPFELGRYKFTKTAPNNSAFAIVNFAYFSAYTETQNTKNYIFAIGESQLPYEPYGNTWTDIPHYIHNTSTDTITTLPADIYANDTTATVGLKGNMSQSSTPSPTTPIQPQECGDMTGNLFDISAVTLGKYINASGEETTSGGTDENVLNHSDYIPISALTTYTFKCEKVAGHYGTSNAFCWFDSSKQLISRTLFTVEESGTEILGVDTAPAGAEYLIMNYRGLHGDTAMLNSGSTPLPYEPYGNKIPILNNSQTTNVYLGEVQSTRQIKKLVLTGQETIALNGKNNAMEVLQAYCVLPSSGTTKATNIICSHLETLTNGSSTYTNEGIAMRINGTDIIFGIKFANVNVSVSDSTGVALTKLKAYLAAQYAAGTPVCVWYVLAEPTTGIVNEPLRKIGNYADEVSGITIPAIAGANTISIGTTLQPSEVTVNYKGWHPVADVHERENGAWD